ncbi:MAG: saccharopine dehydrogenase NADP-binding domain-containing protein [Burkholderiaceae bacterium]|nr:saccharopine dehydrogenase NADP-binding domain-containing protein [Burkholderiaceae bacterium]
MLTPVCFGGEEVQMAGRSYDIVLYGATGFVGSRAAEYLATHGQMRSRRWAIAGRDRRRLEALKQRLGGRPDVLVGDSGDARAMRAVAGAARVVLSTAGPFALYGDALVEACVAGRTHYADITGETVWARSLIDRHHAAAARDGTRIVPFAGFDSVPSDLGTLLAVRHLQRTLGAEPVEVAAYFRMMGGFNGGTIASDMHRRDSGGIEIGRDPFLLDPDDGHPGEEIERHRDPQGIRFDEAIGAWVGPFVMGPINTRVVRRSAALYAAWGEPYGPHFRYQEYTRYGGSLAHAKAALVTGLMSGYDRAMSQPALRALLKNLLPKPGSGPSEATMAGGWFVTEVLAHAADGRAARVRIAFAGDPGNRATLRLLCESGLCLALDGGRLPGGAARGGVLTPATALGEALVPRLRAAGFRIEAGPRIP